ncbi:MAG TPA: protein kinase [Vicinamibacterales bacterium]|jgi:serine/threonine-protein kinase|nr:protein kinase [Vicinamibacterales bacterium]
MSLARATRLGPYEIVSPIGSGGMGEVYRARDTRLDRTVAIKILPAEVADDKEARARFEQESRAIAAIDHPHICAVYDVGVQDGLHYLVMQHLDGETLAERLARTKGPLPLEQALTIAIAVADALDKTHRAGITHRDLKPGNIMLTKAGAKLLDFGLAKLRGTGGPLGLSSMTQVATSAPNTAQGTILGTVQYMAPEQVEGRTADARSDIWAFGTVLFEMVVGERPFAGESAASVIGAILKDHPPFVSARQPFLPRPLDDLVDRCLAKDPDDRWQSIGDVRHQLISIAALSATPSSAVTTRRPRVPQWVRVVGAAVLSAAIGGLAVWSTARRPVETPVRGPIRLAFDLGRDASFATDFPIAALSPDGTRIVFVSAGSDGLSRLSTRRLDQPEATPLKGTEGAYSPFFSPDGEWVGFFGRGKLNKVRVDGGAPIVLCDAPAGRGASWVEQGQILAALDNRSGLSLVTTDGGVVTAATTLGAGELTHRMPHMLPGGKAAVFVVNSAPGSYGAASIAVASLGPTPARARIILPNVGMFPRYLPTGHLVYVANGTLHAVPFDADRLEVIGASTPVLEDVSSSVAFGSAQVDFSREGDLLYLSGRTSGRTVIQWLTADGKVEPLWPEASFYQFPQVSPDGKRLLSVVADGAVSDIWVYDPQRGTKTRVTDRTGVNSYPIWSADGRYVIFQLESQLHWVSADGAERPQVLLKTAGPSFPSFVTADSRLVFYELKPGGGSRIQTVPIATKAGGLTVGEPITFRELSAGNPVPTVSRDGRWVAYASIESGIYEVYVRAFPDTGRQWAVSTGGGSFPVWSSTGNELFYRTEDQYLMVTHYSADGDSFVADKPRVWTNTRIFNTGLIQNFALAPDGKHFAVLMSADGPQPGTTQRNAMLVLNFFDEVRRRVGRSP